MAYRTSAEAKQHIRAQNQNLRLRYSDCVLIRDNYGNPKGFGHFTQGGTKFKAYRDNPGREILSVLVNRTDELTLQQRKNLVTLCRNYRTTGEFKI